MNNKIILSLSWATIILVLIFSGCKTKHKITGEQIVIKDDLTTVFFFTDSVLYSLKEAADVAHDKEQKIFAVINFPEKRDYINNIPIQTMLANLKKEVRNLVTNYDIDGLGIYISDHPQELIEIMTVESMTLKPYIVNFVVWSGDEEYKSASACLREGIVDLMIPNSKIEKSNAALNEGMSHHQLNVKKIKPEQVIKLNLISLFPVNPGGRKLKLGHSNKSLITDSDGCISFISNKTDTLELMTDTGSISISTLDWVVPYSYFVGTDGKTFRKSPWVEFRRMPKEITDVAEYDLLCKTEYPAKVWINGEPLKQYKTGIFFNRIKLDEGVNRIRAAVVTPDSQSIFYEREVTYRKSETGRAAFPLWIDKKSVEPASDLELLSDDMLRVSYQGSPGQDGYIKIMPGKIRLKCSREDFDDYSVYKADLYLKKLSEGQSYNIVREISAPQSSKKVELDFRNKLNIKRINEFPLVKVRNENSRLTYNLSSPRLGGPIRSELGQGVILKTNGRVGDYFRIRLSSIESGFMHKDDVELLPEGSVVPSYFISGMSCGPADGADVLTIPYLEPVPYEIFADPDQNRIVITLYGVQTASTWITHLKNRKIIDRITWQQTTPETYQIFVNLNSSCSWGYDLRPDKKRLILTVKYPPAFDLENTKPLTGIKIAIEAGHGGSNIGAIGLSGLLEKDINLDLSLRLGELCKSMGAEIVQVRELDIDMGLLVKRNIAVKSGANILISIHANAGGRGYLSVAGTSTYWHNPFWAPLAERIYERLLELELKEFGVIGSFNYTVTRASQMPSVLVEQAFMSHAEDEEKLADTQFRQQMAKKIYDGLMDYLKVVK